MSMNMTPVESSNIAAIGHNPQTSILHVQFKGGKTYEYKNVNTELFQQLLTAESIGSFFAKNIKSAPGVYPYSLVP